MASFLILNIFFLYCDIFRKSSKLILISKGLFLKFGIESHELWLFGRNISRNSRSEL